METLGFSANLVPIYEPSRRHV